jgi:hypothetical protein
MSCNELEFKRMKSKTFNNYNFRDDYVAGEKLWYKKIVSKV